MSIEGSKFTAESILETEVSCRDESMLKRRNAFWQHVGYCYELISHNMEWRSGVSAVKTLDISQEEPRLRNDFHMERTRNLNAPGVNTMLQPFSKSSSVITRRILCAAAILGHHPEVANITTRPLLCSEISEQAQAKGIFRKSWLRLYLQERPDVHISS